MQKKQSINLIYFLHQIVSRLLGHPKSAKRWLFVALFITFFSEKLKLQHALCSNLLQESSIESNEWSHDNVIKPPLNNANPNIKTFHHFFWNWREDLEKNTECLSRVQSTETQRIHIFRLKFCCMRTNVNGCFYWMADSARYQLYFFYMEIKNLIHVIYLNLRQFSFLSLYLLIK